MSLRDEIMELPPQERLAYALEIIDEMTGSKVTQQTWAMESLNLTAMEATFFLTLNNNSPRVLSAENLLNMVWPRGEVVGSVVNVMVHKLRKKGIKIENLHGAGYFIEDKMEIGDSKSQRHLKNNMPWTDRDEEDLLIMINNGSSLESMVHETERGLRAVRERIRKLKKERSL